LVDSDRLRLGDLATRRLRLEHVPAGPLEITLELDGRALGSSLVSVPAAGDVSGTLR
jgi:hypothetical protein